MGTTDLVSNLDPAGAYDQGSWILYGNTFQTLLSFPPNQDQPKPDAAKSCGFANASRTVYTCTMRAGLTFSNGDPLTAQDVAFSFNRIKKINAAAGPESLLSNLTSTTASGDTVTFKLSEPDATFPMKISSGAGALVDSKVYPADKLLTGGKLIGSGPYALKDYTKQKVADLTPNADYHGIFKLANAGATIRYYADGAALAAALKAKKVDFVPRDLPPAVENQYQEGSSAYQTIAISSGTENIMVFDSTHAPFDQPAVRQAVASLVDRSALVGTVFQHTVTPLYSLVPQGVLGHTTPFFDKYGSDPDEQAAATDLQRAGIHTPVKFTLSYATGPAPKPEAVELAKELNASGLFQVDIQDVHTLAAMETGWTHNKYDAFTVGWSADYPDADDFIAPLLEDQGVFNNGYHNASINSWLKQSRTMASRPAADGLFGKIQQQEAADAPIVPLWQSKDYAVSASNVQGAALSTSASGVTCLWMVSVGSTS
ncbi:ABC transporter substrate-binding protein [Streptomyces sp. SL13]|uniref:ABC transporter substrate-binding protein n=2 Tax=Streptantibioticus silvisoli TaxID=2705255 RepID=A0AA90GZ78_9ACTN|nr:ABC transporter substrate-binding protein [Streptantibioticus silvisoli]